MQYVIEATLDHSIGKRKLEKENQSIIIRIVE